MNAADPDSRRPRWVVVLMVMGAAVAVSVLAMGWRFLRGERLTPEGQPPLTTLTAANFPGLRAAFNEAADETRLVALLSPT